MGGGIAYSIPIGFILKEEEKFLTFVMSVILQGSN